MIILRENPIEQFQFRIQPINKKQWKIAEAVEVLNNLFS